MAGRLNTVFMQGLAEPGKSMTQILIRCRKAWHQPSPEVHTEHIPSGKQSSQRLKDRIPKAAERIEKLQDSISNVSRFVEKAKRYTEIPELTQRTAAPVY